MLEIKPVPVGNSKPNLAFLLWQTVTNSQRFRFPEMKMASF